MDHFSMDHFGLPIATSESTVAIKHDGRMCQEKMNQPTPKRHCDLAESDPFRNNKQTSTPSEIKNLPSSSVSKREDRIAQGTMNHLPMDYGLSENDVLFGRGKTRTEHIGNQKLRNLVHANLEEYERIMTKKSKTLLIQNIINYIRAKQGKFIKYDKLGQKYYEVSDLLAHEKVSQAFRDALSVLEKSNKPRIKKVYSDSLRVQLHKTKPESSEVIAAQRNIRLRRDTSMKFNETTTSNAFQNYANSLPLHLIGTQQVKSEPQLIGFTSDSLVLHQQLDGSNYFNQNVRFCLQEQSSLDDCLKATERFALQVGGKAYQDGTQSTLKTSDDCNSEDSNSDAAVFDKLEWLTNKHLSNFPNNDDNPFEPRHL